MIIILIMVLLALQHPNFQLKLFATSLLSYVYDYTMF